MPNDLDCYAIVIQGNEKSEYYFDYCRPSWEKAGIKVKRFDAITPDVMPRDLQFAKYSSAAKYTKKGIQAEISPTEKACFYSHFYLWQKASMSARPMLILEHDTFLEKPENLWYDKKYGAIFYDKAAMGSYIMQPSFANDFVDYIYDISLTKKISSGPFAYIRSFGDLNNRQDEIVNDVHPKYKPASNQVMSRKYGNTISHFSDGKKEYVQHNFIIID